MDIKEFKKNAMRDALDKVHSWKQEHQDDYSRFSLDMMKMMRNDFSQLERIFKMAAKYVPTSVLIECQKLLTPNTDTILSDDEKTAVAVRIVDEMMEFTGYLRLGLYSEVIGGHIFRSLGFVAFPRANGCFQFQQRAYSGRTCNNIKTNNAVCHSCSPRNVFPSP